MTEVQPTENTQENAEVVVEQPTKFTSVFKLEAKDGLTEAVAKIFEGQELSDEFKAKAKDVLEAVVVAKVNEQLEAIEPKIQEELKKQKDENFKQVSEEMETYLEMVVEDWKEENQVALENGIKAKMLEDFVADFRSLLETYNIDITDAEVTQLEEKEAEIEALKAQINGLTEQQIQSKKDAHEQKVEAELNKISEGLAATQTEKLKTLAKDLDNKDIPAFIEKAKVIKDSLFSEAKVEPKQELLGEKKSEEMDPAIQRLFGKMKNINSNE